MTKSFKSLTPDARLDLLIADAQIALTLLESATLASDDAVRTRQIEAAQKAYLKIMLRLPNVSVDEAKLKPLGTHLRLLRDRLIGLTAISDRDGKPKR